MSQNDLLIDNQSFPATRSDINSALQALGSNNSGLFAPSTTYANMTWYDTGQNILKIRSEADDAWIPLMYLHQSLNVSSIINDTHVVTTVGNSVGRLGDQNTGTWQAGTGTTESLVSPAKVRAAVDAVAEGALKLDAISAGTSVKLSKNSLSTRSQDTFAQLVKVGIFQNGSFRLTLQQKRGGFGGSSIVEVLKNDVLVQSWSTSSTSFVNRSLDISVVAGNDIVIQHRNDDDNNNTSDVQLIRFQTTGATIWPLFTIGIEDVAV